MQASLIKPTAFSLPAVKSKVIFFYGLQHLYQFGEIIGHKIKLKSFGPVRRCNMEIKGETFTALAGFIGAPMAVMTAENAIASGGKEIFSFGTAGWIGSGKIQYGEIRSPQKALDNTGIIQDYGSKDDEVRLSLLPGIQTCQTVVSLNSIYALYPNRLKWFQEQGSELMDMECAPLAFVAKLRKCNFHSIFVVSDAIRDSTWSNGVNTSDFKNGLEKSLVLLASLVVDTT